MLGLYESFHIHSSRYQVDELNCFNRVLSLCSRLRGDEVRGFFFLHPFQRSSSKRKVFSKHKEKCQDKDGRKSIENDYKIICCCTIVGIITPAQVWPHWHTKKLPRKLTSVYMNAVLGCQGLTEGLPSPHQNQQENLPYWTWSAHSDLSLQLVASLTRSWARTSLYWKDAWWGQRGDSSFYEGLFSLISDARTWRRSFSSLLIRPAYMKTVASRLLKRTFWLFWKRINWRKKLPKLFRCTEREI